MSKRFGRQQKRKMRAEIARLQASMENQSQSIELLRRSGRSMRDALEVTAAVLGEHFVGLPAQEQCVSRLDQPYKMPDRSYGLPATLDMSSNIDLSEAVSFSVRRLDVMRADAITDLQGAVHVRLTTPAGDYGYAVDPMVIHRMPKWALIQHFSGEFARLLADKVEGLKK